MIRNLETLVEVINELHESTRARVFTSDVDTELLDIIAGVLQSSISLPSSSTLSCDKQYKVERKS